MKGLIVLVTLFAGAAAADPNPAKPATCSKDGKVVVVIRHMKKDLIRTTTDDNIPHMQSQFAVHEGGYWEYWETEKKGLPKRDLHGCVADKKLDPARAALAKAKWKTTKATTAQCNDAPKLDSWIEYEGSGASYKEAGCTSDVLDADSAKALAEMRKIKTEITKVPVPGHKK